jgi:DNA-binding response OmpR family regulator
MTRDVKNSSSDCKIMQSRPVSGAGQAYKLSASINIENETGSLDSVWTSRAQRKGTNSFILYRVTSCDLKTQGHNRMMLQILVIDDDIELCELVAEYLEPEGFRIEAVHDGGQGVQRALSGEHALAVLDYMLPGLNGFEVLRQIRAQSRLPVVMLTARGDDVNRIIGLQIGADDYLPKPFNPLELVARINAVLRRAQAEPDQKAIPEVIAVGDVEMDNRTRTVLRAGEQIELTVVEYSLLEKMLGAPGRIVTREELVKDVLHRELSPFDRSIDTHVSNLRKKLGHQVNGVERVKTVRGVGYIYAKAEESKTERQESEVVSQA